jgi:hypothetical protein
METLLKIIFQKFFQNVFNQSIVFITNTDCLFWRSAWVMDNFFDTIKFITIFDIHAFIGLSG